jgi:hypothetical protein
MGGSVRLRLLLSEAGILNRYISVMFRSTGMHLAFLGVFLCNLCHRVNSRGSYVIYTAPMKFTGVTPFALSSALKWGPRPYN